jgi:hypothetical protein
MSNALILLHDGRWSMDIIYAGIIAVLFVLSWFFVKLAEHV